MKKYLFFIMFFLLMGCQALQSSKFYGTDIKYVSYSIYTPGDYYMNDLVIRTGGAGKYAASTFNIGNGYYYVADFGKNEIDSWVTIFSGLLEWKPKSENDFVIIKDNVTPTHEFFWFYAKPSYQIKYEVFQQQRIITFQFESGRKFGIREQDMKSLITNYYMANEILIADTSINKT